MVFDKLFIIPARSGSKGLVDKNIKYLGGLPLLEWTARAVRQANIGNSFTLVSTDSERYAKLARELGVSAPFLRPAELSSDTASAVEVILHALQWFETENSYLPELFMWLQPTSPFRSSTEIMGAFTLLEDLQADAVISCKEIHRDLTALFRYENNFMSPLNKDQPAQTARQSIKPLLTPNGGLYLCRTSSFLQHNSLYPEKTAPLIMSALQSLDIDTEEDWLMAEAFIQQGLVRAD